MLGIKIVEWLLIGALGYWLARRSFRRYRANSTRTDGTLREVIRWYAWPDIRNEDEARREFGGLRASGPITVVILIAPALIYGLAIHFDRPISDSSLYTMIAVCGGLSAASAFIWHTVRREKLWPLLAISLAISLAALAFFVLPLVAAAFGYTPWERIGPFDTLIWLWILQEAAYKFRTWMWYRAHPDASRKFDPYDGIFKPRPPKT